MLPGSLGWDAGCGALQLPVVRRSRACATQERLRLRLRARLPGSLEWEQGCRALGLQPRWRELLKRLVRLPGSLGWDAGCRELQLQQWPGLASKAASCCDCGCYATR